MSDKITETPYHLYPKHSHSVSHKTVFSLTPAAKTPVLFLKTEKEKRKEKRNARLPLSFPPLNSQVDSSASSPSRLSINCDTLWRCISSVLICSPNWKKSPRKIEINTPYVSLLRARGKIVFSSTGRRLIVRVPFQY